ncbi:MAG: hypothetical protein HYZ44_15905 [Bacteroidetes bacterium]|nr:hypothetical protein [Bacteroidota bacterium]
MRLIYCLLFLAVCQHAVSQDAIIVLRDSVKVKTELISIAENNVFTKAGTFGLTEIYSVRFQTANDVAAKSQLVDKLVAGGVIVYEGNKKLDRKPVAVVESTVNKQSSSTSQPLPSQPQKNEEKEDLPSGSFGVGFGQDYGGIGARFTLLPDQHLGIFGSVGYIFAGIGYNFGVMARIKPENKVVPTFSVMYGYNAAIKITGASQYDKIYNGVSIGAGIISKSYRDPKNYWHFGLILPFRPSEFDTDFNALNSNPGISGLQKPLPVTFSVGYHFSF